MATDNFSKLRSQMAQPLTYPANLRVLNRIEFRASLQDQLQRRESRLFSEEVNLSPTRTGPAVALWELHNFVEGHKSTPFYQAADLNTHLHLPLSANKYEPFQRFFFIHAPNSRKPLNITKEMLLQILTCHTVMPSFLEFVFPFGKQNGSRDLLMGFRSESRILQSSRRFPVKELGRSGRHLEFCYSLKSIERTGEETSEPAQDWSLRQCSIHHSFDLETQQSTWIVIKANDKISAAFKERTAEARTSCEDGCYDSDALFATSLALHRFVASWASENWSWYIHDLETHLKTKTDRALAASEKVHLYPSTTTLAADSNPVPVSKKQRTFSFDPIKRAVTGMKRGNVIARRTTFAAQNAIPIHKAMGFDKFSFRDIQHVQYVEESANEMLTVLRANSKILKDLSREYQNLLSFSSRDGIPDGQQERWRAEIIYFETYVSNVIQDLQMQQARAESLLRVVAERKALLMAILQYRSMEASKLYAENAQNSAFDMQDMTRDMHVLAKKTKIETVSMRIITWVTLFFLPGTFISTLMSTPIVHFDKNTNGFTIDNIGFGALKLYLIVSLPLVLLTVLAYLSVLLFDKYKEKKDRDKLDNELDGGNEKQLAKGG